MANISKTDTGKWRAQVARKGVRKSKIFPTKREATDWAAREEYLILNNEAVQSAKSFGDILDRYAKEVSPSKRGHRWELVRIEKLRRDPLARIRMGDLTAQNFATWRDKRLTEVQPGSVRREMDLMSAVITRARKEWGAIKSNPLADVAKPRKPKARDRRPTPDEIEKMRFVAGTDLTKATARTFHAFLFAIETAMRAGEIARLTWDDISIPKRTAHLTHTKNGESRDVPLSAAAVALLEVLPEMTPVFGLSVRQIDVLYRKTRDKAGIVGLTFHDSRHEAITRLSRKLEVLDLARMVGHKNLNELLTYYNESAESIARRLD